MAEVVYGSSPPLPPTVMSCLFPLAPDVSYVWGWGSDRACGQHHGHGRDLWIGPASGAARGKSAALRTADL